MKKILAFALTLIVLLCTNNIEAQRTRVQKGAKGQKTVVHKGQRGKKTVVHKGQRGKTTVVRKGRKGNVAVVKRKRVTRTKVVHHHYRHLPRRGAVVKTVHVNAITVRHQGIGFRYHSGIWYRPRGTSWVIARPAYGVRIGVLPVGYRKIVIGPRPYYYYYGTYYVQNNNEYEVVEAPMGAEIDSLPEGYNVTTVNGSEYYELDDVYYMPTETDEGEEILVVVDNPNER
jgi:hypothetical protein